MTAIDNLYNTGMYKKLVLELLVCCVMNYPSLYGEYYVESAINSAGTQYVLNDFLLAFMVFIRLRYLVKVILILSDYQ